MFIFWLGLKWRLRNGGMEGDESERGVFNCAEVVITSGPFSIQATDLDIGEQCGSLCTALSLLLFPL